MCNSNNLLYTPKPHEYRAYRADGTILQKGDKLPSKDVLWDFVSCTHPRKIYVEAFNDPNGPHSWPNRESCEYYANVFNLGIYDMNDAEWTFRPSWNTSDIDAKLYEEFESRYTDNLTDADVWASYDKNVQADSGDKTYTTDTERNKEFWAQVDENAETDMWAFIDQLYQRVTQCDGTVILTPRTKSDETDIPWVSPGPSESEKAEQAERVRKADAWVETDVWEKTDRTETWGEMVEANETDIADDDDKAELVREADEQAELHETDTANDK